MRLRLFATIVLTLGLGLGACAVDQPEPGQVQAINDLADLGRQARGQRLPILIMFTQKHCHFCKLMEENYLHPMLRNASYRDRVVIRKLRIDTDDTLIDFDGRPIEVQALKTRYQTTVTPTLVFVDHEGREIAERLVGIGTEGLFAGDIDQAIDKALSRMRHLAAR